MLASPLPVAPPSLVAPAHHLLPCFIERDLSARHPRLTLSGLLLASLSPLSPDLAYLGVTPTLTKAESNDLAMGKVVDEALANLQEQEITGLDLEEPPQGWELAAYLNVLTTTERASLHSSAACADSVTPRRA